MKWAFGELKVVLVWSFKGCPEEVVDGEFLVASQAPQTGRVWGGKLAAGY